MLPGDVLSCWGKNSNGQLGRAVSAQIPVVDQFCVGSACGTPSTTIHARDVALGTGHSCVVRLNGEIACSGQNNLSQLGDGLTVNRAFFASTSGGGGTYTAISAGSDHTCALRADGSVWCWGANSLAQAGQAPSSVPLVVPTQVSALSSGVTDLDSGSYHTCVLKAEGTVWCWGANSQGQLGDGTTTQTHVPVRVVFP